jgi:hypothetical protein
MKTHEKAAWRLRSGPACKPGCLNELGSRQGVPHQARGASATQTKEKAQILRPLCASTSYERHPCSRAWATALLGTPPARTALRIKLRQKVEMQSCGPGGGGWGLQQLVSPWGWSKKYYISHVQGGMPASQLLVQKPQSLTSHAARSAAQCCPEHGPRWP